MGYNPFEHKIGELSAADLERLFDIKATEGYYIQYSAGFPTSAKLGQGIASFANTYGGWYIIGIRADKHVAKEVCGFDLSAHPEPITALRENLDAEIDPVPVYFPQLLPLGGGKAVLVIYVPDNQETPFVSKDGRIYRRTHDASEPVPENSRYTIDRLFDLGREITGNFRDFCDDPSFFPGVQPGQGRIKVFLAPYPPGSVKKPDIITTATIEAMLKRTQAKIQIPFSGSQVLIGGYLPFASVQNTHQSAILRQTDPTLGGEQQLWAEFFNDGRARFNIPLNYLPVLSKWNLNQIETVAIRAVLSKYTPKKEGNIPPLNFFDIGHLWLTVACLLSFYQEWLGSDPLLAELLFGITIESASRSAPFFDSDEWGGYVEKNGLPTLNTHLVRIPHYQHGRGGGSRIRLSSEWPLWLEIAYFLSLAFGLPPEIYSNTLLKALERAAREEISISPERLLSIRE